MRRFFILSLLLGSGCQATPSHPAPLTRFHFPTGLAVDAPYGSDAGAHALYVAGFTNFDLAQDNGLVYALNLDEMTLADGATFLLDALAFDAGWNGTPLQVPDLDAGAYWDREAGVVITDSMAGEMRLTTTSNGASRLFMASRYSNLVTAIDVENGTGLQCFGGGTNCNNQVAAPPLVIEQSPGANQLLDVFGVSNEIVTSSGERDVFITHLRDQAYGSGGVTSSSAYGNNFSATGEAYVVRQNVDIPSCRLAEPVGPVGTSASVALTHDNLIYTLVTGRYGGLSNAVRVLTLPSGGCQGPDAGQVAIDLNPPNLFNVDLSFVVGGNDGRGIELSTSGDRAFALVRNPDSLVVLRISGATPDGLLIHPSSVTPLPPGPTELFPIPRVANGTPIGDLVAISCADSSTLVFYDDQLGMVTAALPNVGNEPFAIAGAARTVGVGAASHPLSGIRLFVTDFGSGQIAVVDVPDLMDARTARVVAFIGTWEDTTASPINPSNSILNAPIAGGPSGIP